MSQTLQIEAVPTPLAKNARSGSLLEFAGVQTARAYTSAAEELRALTEGAGVFDAGWLSRLRITGADRVRWLNGMVTNTVKDLAPGHLHYTFLLNAQGRIQGDGDVYALADSLLFATDHSQAERLREHLDRFIIMDEVELAPEPEVTAIGLAGAQVSAVLHAVQLPGEGLAPGTFTETGDVLLARHAGHRYTLWIVNTDAETWWERLLAAGAAPCGVEAVEALRVLSGIPRYGVDMHDKSLPQETGQMRALHFNKGCYLGQEIVERIRSRATVHRGVRVFSLEGAAPAANTPLFASDKPEAPVGELTSICAAELPRAAGVFALGTVRTEAAGGPLTYSGGTATALRHAPLQME